MQKKTAIYLTKQLVTADERGQILYDSGEQLSESFVRAFQECLQAAFSRANRHFMDITGSAGPLASFGTVDHTLMQINAPAGNAHFGIVVGSGAGAVTLGDTRLGTQIIHGTAAGQLFHEVCTVWDISDIAGGLRTRITRMFTNHTTASIVVRECGIYTQGHATVAPRHHCIVRDLITPEITLAPAAVLNVEYRIDTML